MDFNTLFVSGILLASSGIVVYALREIPKKVFEWGKRKTLYSVTVYQQDELFDVLEEWLFQHYRNHYKDVEATLCYPDGQQCTPNESPVKELRFKQEENFFIAKIDGRSVFISKTKEKLDKAQSLREIFYRRYIIRGWMAKEQINTFLKNIVEEHNQKKKKGLVKVYANNFWGDWTCIHDITVKPFSKVVMKHEEKNMLIDDLDNFIASADWYKERGIRYKRGYLFHGSPGNGKTTIASAISEYLGRDVYILNLNSLENDGYLIKAFSNLGKNIVLLIEDIDRSFAKRENIDSKVSFSSLLNSFDGVLCKDGIITVITTNFIEKLDEALVREGRVDLKFQIDNPSPEQVKEYVEMFYGVKIANPITGNGHSMSYVQEFCIRHKDNPLAATNHFADQKTA
jgi:chaperone BCS1